MAEEKPTFKYTVEDLAKELDIQPASVRVALRKADVPKNGSAYGWNSDKDFQAVVKKLKVEPKAAKAKTDKPAKPAPKSSDKASTKAKAKAA